MACTTFTSSSASPSASNVTFSRTNNKVSAPCSVFFPSMRRPAATRLLLAQATGDNKDTLVEVHHSSGQGGNNQSTAVERRRPTRMALDISPFGKSHCSLHFIFVKILKLFYPTILVKLLLYLIRKVG